MAYRALTEVLLGNQPPALAGELIPDTFTNMTGHAEPVDFDRLLEIGAVEKVGDGKLSTLTRPELDERAAAAGVENPEDLANKAQVIEAIKPPAKRSRARKASS